MVTDNFQVLLRSP